MIGHLRIKSPWSQLGVFTGALGAGFIVASLLMGIVAMAKGMPLAQMDKLDWTQPGVLTTMKWIQAISSLIIFLFPAVVFALLVFNGKPFYFLGLRPPVSNNMYLLAVAAVVLAFPFVLWLGEINQHIPLPKWMTGLEKDAAKQMEAFLKADNTAEVLINVFIVAFLPAICEELCFRGALQRILIHLFKSPWTGIVVTAILFSAFHLQFQGFLPRMFLGIVLGALYWYSGSLWTSIIAHFVFNAVQVVVVSYAPKYVSQNPSMPLFAAMISAAAVFTVLWMYRKDSNITYDKVYQTEELNRSNQFLA